MADNLHKQRAFHIEDFRGMDYSSSKIKAAPYRAIDGYNWIRKNGTNQKRNGWRQIVDTLDSHINCIFPYKDSHGNDEALIFTANTAYRLLKTNTGSGVEWTAIQTWTEIEDNEPVVKSLFAGDGTGLMEPKRTTESGFIKLTDLADRRLMASYSVNRIYIPAGGYYVYDVENKVMYDIARELPSEYSLSDVYELHKKGIIYIPTIYSVDTSSSTIDEVNVALPFRMLNIGSNAKYSNLANIVPNGTVALKVVGTTESSVTIDTSSTSTIGACKLIYHQENSTSLNPGLYTANAPFGLAGYADRIFLGAPTSGQKNRVWFSEMDNYSYFPERNYADIGSNKTSVTAFLRTADNVLAIFKERGKMDSSINYMSGSLKTSGTYGTASYKETAVFRVANGAETQTAINGFCTANLPGDSVFLASDGIYGVVLMENLATDQRTTRERSRLIKAKLEKTDLSNASIYSYDNKLFVADGQNIFVADSEQKLNAEESIAWQYEWYFWKNAPVRVWTEIDGELAFGTEEGRICAFDKSFESYSDVTITTAQLGTIGSGDENDTIQSSSDSEFFNGIKKGSKVNVFFPNDEVYIQKREWNAEDEQFELCEPVAISADPQIPTTLVDPEYDVPTETTFNGQPTDRVTFIFEKITDVSEVRLTQIRIATDGETHRGAFDIVIPETVVSSGVEYPVTEIGDQALRHSDGTLLGYHGNLPHIKRIFVPYSVTSLSKGCFASSEYYIIADNGIEFVLPVLPINDIYNFKELFYNYNPYGADFYSIPPYNTKVTIRPNPNIGYAIPEYCFKDMDKVTEIVLLDGVTSIGSDAFYGCSSLTSITIPNSVTSIGMYAFSGTPILSNLTTYGNAKYFGNPDNPYLVLAKAINTDIESCDIHEDTRFIYFEAFDGCTKLKMVSIPNGLKDIGMNAFKNCSALEKIVYFGDSTSFGNINKQSGWAYNAGNYSLQYTVRMSGVTPTVGELFISNGVVLYIQLFREMNGENRVVINADISSLGNEALQVEQIKNRAMTCFVRDKDTEESTFKLNDEKGPVIFMYGGAGLSTRLYNESPVHTLWLSPAFNLGLETYRKTLLGITLTAAERDGRLIFGYATRSRASNETTARMNDLDFGDFDFTNFTVDEYDTAAISVRMHERNFSYIQFVIRSEDDKNCSIDSATLVYKFSQKNRGIG